MKIGPANQRAIVRNCQSSLAFSQHVTQGGVFLNFKEALKMLHIDSEHVSEDLMDIKWIVRKPHHTVGRNSPSPMRQAMTTMSGFGTKGSQGVIKDYATEMIKRAKTPMLSKTIDADASKDKIQFC